VVDEVHGCPSVGPPAAGAVTKVSVGYWAQPPLATGKQILESSAHSHRPKGYIIEGSSESAFPHALVKTVIITAYVVTVTSAFPSETCYLLGKLVLDYYPFPGCNSTTGQLWASGFQISLRYARRA
jgi:hypothetical protein